jgi:hypothetical protein
MRRKTFGPGPAVIVCLGALTSAHAQSCYTWTQRSATGPSPRHNHAMAYDSARQVVVLFGGEANGSILGNTWEWNGDTGVWQLRTTSTSPSNRSDAAMAFDPVRNRMYLFGGSAGATETWEYTGTNWSSANPAGTPSGRRSHAMVYDAARARTVMYGGFGGLVTYGDTLEWDGISWVQRTSPTNPPASSAHRMAFDPIRGRCVLTGGTMGAQTWERTGTDWALRNSAGPGADRAGMAFDVLNDRVVVFGGLVNAAPVNSLWEWNPANNVWSQVSVANSPSARSGVSMVYDAHRSTLVMFGGLTVSGEAGDTWELRGVPSPVPVIARVQTPQSVLEGNRATIFVVPQNTVAAFQWQKNGVPLQNGGRVAGADSPILTIDAATAADTAAYTCLLSNNCSTSLSPAVPLSVQCYANCDGSTQTPVLNVGDFTCFLQKYSSGCP